MTNLVTAIALLHKAFQQQTVTELQLQQVGTSLWPVCRPLLLASHTPMQRIICLNTQAYPNLYWESLWHPVLHFLAKHPDYTFYHQWVNTQISSKQPFPLRILLFTIQSEKELQTTLEIETEQQVLYTVLQPFIQQGLVTLQMPDDGRFSTFTQLLEQAWHLVILSGHAVLSEQADIHFLFETTEGQTTVIPTTQLMRYLQNARIECLVLAVCHSAQLAADLHPYIPHVVGMRDKVLDRASHVFIQHFCQHLLQQQRVDIAVQQARIAMTQLLAPEETWSNAQLKTIVDPSQGQWSLPTLYSQNPLRTLTATVSATDLTPVQATPPPFLIGQRLVLRQLMTLLQQTKAMVWLTGEAGTGKTTIARRICWQLQQQGYDIFYSFDALPLTSTRPYLLYLEVITTETLPNIQQCLVNLNGACLFVSRQFFDSELPMVKYALPAPHFTDFLRYSRYLKLPHTQVQLRLIYHLFKGNFTVVQLFQNLPFTTDKALFHQQLAIAKRFLRGKMGE